MIIRPEAEADLADARAWYERQRAGLGDAFLLAAEEALQRIDRLPRINREVYQDVRRALTRRFPYAIYYRLEGDEVVVLAVVHARRDPKHWQSRI